MTYMKPTLDSIPDVLDKVQARRGPVLRQVEETLVVRALDVHEMPDSDEAKVTVTYCDPKGGFHTFEYWRSEIEGADDDA